MFLFHDQIAISYREWLNDSQGLENRTIQNFAIVTITTVFIGIYTYI